MSTSGCWLVTTEGVRLRLDRGCTLAVPPDRSGTGGAVVALVPTPDGAELVVTGGRRVRVNGAVTDHAFLTDGDVLDIGTERFTLACPGEREVVRYDVELGTLRVGVTRLGYTIGGGDLDDLRVSALPPGVVRFGSAEIVVGSPAAIGGFTVSAGATVPLGRGGEIALGAVRLAVRERGTTETGLPDRLELEADGRLLAWIGERGPIPVLLTALRRRLFQALIRAWPRPVADDELIAAVWLRVVVRTRLDVNQLVFRTRRELQRAGIDGQVLHRSPAGGQTSLQLAEPAKVADRSPARPRR